jgi:hypothetical protein
MWDPRRQGVFGEDGYLGALGRGGADEGGGVVEVVVRGEGLLPVELEG